MSSRGPIAQPVFQPVTLKVFAALDTVTVRSRMPGSDAIGVWVRPSKTKCS